MIRTFLLGAALAAAPLAAFAHPHDVSDQQAILSTGMDGAEAIIVIVPGTTVAADLAAWLDADGSGSIEADEADAAAAAILAGVTLTLDGTPVALQTVELNAPPPAEIATATASVVLRAEAGWSLPPGEYEIAFAIDWTEFGADWFIQPYYDPDLVDAVGYPSLERSEDGSRVDLGLAVPSS